MTDEFQKGLITGLAMQPLQVTTEHSTPDPTAMMGFGHTFLMFKGFINIFRTTGQNTEAAANEEDTL